MLYLQFPDSLVKMVYTIDWPLCASGVSMCLFPSHRSIGLFVLFIFLHLFIGKGPLKSYYTDSAIIFSNLIIFHTFKKFNGTF